MAAFLFHKVDVTGDNYNIEGQLLRESISPCYTCNCFPLHCNYNECHQCCICNSPVIENNWNTICQFMVTDKINRDAIARLINKNRLSPLTPKLAKHFSLDENKIKKFNPKYDTNAFIVALDDKNNWSLFMFTKHNKEIKRNNRKKIIDDVELSVINVKHGITVLTPNWNYENGFNRWIQ